MTDHNTTEQSVIRCVAASTGIPVAEITADSRIRDDLDLDSLDFMSVIMELEDVLCIDIEDDVLEKITTVRGLVEAVTERLQGEVSA